jgi:hypothetical protein
MIRCFQRGILLLAIILWRDETVIFAWTTWRSSPGLDIIYTSSRLSLQGSNKNSNLQWTSSLMVAPLFSKTDNKNDNSDPDGYDNDNDDDFDDHYHQNTALPTQPVLERLQVAGVSISPKGFHIILQKSSFAAATINNSDSPYSPRYIAIQVSSNPADALAATSPESLTLCQLLSGVDMAGAILPPELLSKLVMYHMEEKRQNNQKLEKQEQAILDSIQEALSRTSQDSSYKDAHAWLQSRIKLPQVTLDQLTLVPTLDANNNKLRWDCRMECALPEWKERLVLPRVEPDILSSLAFQYDPNTSLLFTCMALALRYKAPIVLEQEQPSDCNNDVATRKTLAHRYILTQSELQEKFPQRTTVGKLQQQSTRVAENIERGFEIHKLQGALTIAMRLGDQEAAKRIRAKLDQYDSMQDLPTTATTTAVNDDQNDQENTNLDDLDRNILQ